MNTASKLPKIRPRCTRHLPGKPGCKTKPLQALEPAGTHQAPVTSTGAHRGASPETVTSLGAAGNRYKPGNRYKLARPRTPLQALVHAGAHPETVTGTGSAPKPYKFGVFDLLLDPSQRIST